MFSVSDEKIIYAYIPIYNITLMQTDTKHSLAQSAGAAEYTDCISSEE